MNLQASSMLDYKERSMINSIALQVSDDQIMNALL